MEPQSTTYQQHIVNLISNNNTTINTNATSNNTNTWQQKKHHEKPSRFEHHLGFGGMLRGMYSQLKKWLCVCPKMIWIPQHINIGHGYCKLMHEWIFWVPYFQTQIYLSFHPLSSTITTDGGKMVKIDISWHQFLQQTSCRLHGLRHCYRLHISQHHRRFVSSVGELFAVEALWRATTTRRTGATA